MQGDPREGPLEDRVDEREVEAELRPRVVQDHVRVGAVAREEGHRSRALVDEEVRLVGLVPRRSDRVAEVDAVRPQAGVE